MATSVSISCGIISSFLTIISIELSSLTTDAAHLHLLNLDDNEENIPLCREKCKQSGMKCDPALLHSSKSKRENVFYCETEECIQKAENMQRTIDKSTNPCFDFYDYSCRWANDSKDELEKAESKIYDQILQIIKAPVKTEDRRSLKMAKGMFQSCLIHYCQIPDLKNIIKNIGGWWYIDPDWKPGKFSSLDPNENFTLESFYQKSIEMGYYPKSLFTIDVVTDTKDNKKKIIRIREPNFDSPYDLYFKQIPRTKQAFFDPSVLQPKQVSFDDDFFLDTYLPLMSAKLGILDPSLYREMFRDYDMMANVVEYAYRLEAKNVRMTLAEINGNFSNIPWTAILNAIFNPIPINDTEVILFQCPKCMVELNERIGTTSKSAIVTYLMWSLITKLSLEVDNEIMFEYLKKINMTKEKYCAYNTFKQFRRVVDYEYVERYFDKCSICEISSYVKLMKKTMVEIINQSSTLDAKTKGYAIDKVRNMAFKIGYDDQIQKQEQVEEYFAELNVEPKQYLLSFLNISKHSINKRLRGLRTPPAAPYLDTTNQNGAYASKHNTVLLGAQVTTTPFYSRNRPEYLNFGTLGTVIAHEMSHAFDNEGYRFDKRGILFNWWQPESKKKFQEKFNCLKSQYSNFTNVETGNKVDGENVFMEIFGDNGGIPIAYKAYGKWLEHGKQVQTPQEPLLLNFQHYTPRQMFWLTFASMMCSKNTKEEVLQRENEDNHAEGRARVHGVVMNSADFARDWKCKENTVMNPKEKCNIWA